MVHRAPLASTPRLLRVVFFFSFFFPFFYFLKARDLLKPAAGEGLKLLAPRAPSAPSALSLNFWAFAHLAPLTPLAEQTLTLFLRTWPLLKRNLLSVDERVPGVEVGKGTSMRQNASSSCFGRLVAVLKEELMLNAVLLIAQVKKAYRSTPFVAQV